MSDAQWEFWIDRGGTFTDVVAKDANGTLHSHKLLSSNPERYVDAAEQGIRDVMGLKTGAPIPDGAIRAVKMGTTVATNALLERKGEAVLLLITQGFKDLLRIGYQTRPDLFALHIQRPDLLYQSAVEITGRLDASGAEVTPLDVAGLRDALQAGYDAGLRSVAIAFMHAYLNPAHEQRAAEIACDIGFTQVSTSSDVSRLAKLVSRADTTVVDAYLSPILRRYVDQVAGALRLGQACKRLMFMQSNDGLTDAQNFQGRDAILPGPAGGGGVGMMRTVEAEDFDRLIGFDMGAPRPFPACFGPNDDAPLDVVATIVAMQKITDQISTATDQSLTPVQVADGFLQIAVYNMANAIKKISVERARWGLCFDSARIDLQGNDEIELPTDGVFVLETSGGGGFS